MWQMLEILETFKIRYSTRSVYVNTKHKSIPNKATIKRKQINQYTTLIWECDCQALQLAQENSCASCNASVLHR